MKTPTSLKRLIRSPRLRFWTWAHRLTAGTFLLLLVLAGRGFIPWLQGTAIAAVWFGWLTFFDPLAGLEIALASRHVSVTMLIGLATTVPLTLLFGRFFCAWLCPLGLLMELNDQLHWKLRGRLLRRGVRLPQVALPKSWKYWILAGCLIISAVVGVPVFTTLSPINLLVLCLAFGIGPVLLVVILATLLLFEHFSRRAFCRSLCPLGALYSLLGRYAPVRVGIRQENARLKCRQCSTQCPMGIRVMEDHINSGRHTVTDPECTRCGTCIDACPGDTLGMTFKPRAPKPDPNQLPILP